MKSHFFSKFTRLTALSICISAAFNANAIESKVRLDQGLLIGVNKSELSVTEWLGVPYAQAPVGQLRWKEPVSLPKSNSEFVADKFGNKCPQNAKKGVIGNEDCLTLNIYRPDSDETLPVLVYYHGGNNQKGDASELNPETFVNDLNAVVVSVNYRLGPLGFNPLQALKTENLKQASGNFSLLDQAKSLDWIKENIAQFGGDPDSITVSGFSAGGRDVMAMLISPVFENKFQRAVVFSGGMTTSDVTESQNIFSEKLANLVVDSGIQSDVRTAQKWLNRPHKDVRDFLYSLSDVDLVKYFPKAGIRMKKFPHLYKDGVVIPKEGFDTKSYNSVPVMMLTGKDEFSFFAMSDPYFKKKGILSETDSYLDYDFVFKYGGLLYKRFNVEKSAEKMISSYDAPIYASEFFFGHDGKVVGDNFKKFGSFHGSYLPMLDDSMVSPFFSYAYSLKGAKELSTIFKSHLNSFVHHGNPDSVWVRWNKDSKDAGKSIYIMDANKSGAVTYLSSTDYSDKDVVNMMDKDVSLSKERKEYLINNVLNGRWFSEEVDKLASVK